MKTRVGFAFLLVFSLGAGSAYAQDSKADRLFNEAKELVAAKKYAQACPKYEESNKLEPAIGTQFNLADCYENIGRTTAAWKAFLEVARTAQASGKKERERAARDRAGALEPRLPRITVRLEKEQAGVVIKLDDAVVGREQLGKPEPVEPGEHTVVATGPSGPPFTKTVTARDGATDEVVVPAFAGTAAPVTAPTEQATAPAVEATPSEKKLKTLRIVAVAGGAVGVLGLAAGGFFGLQALSKQDEANCPDNLCDRSNSNPETLRDAQSAGTLSTVFFVGGGVVVAGSAVLWFMAPKLAQGSERASARLVPTAGPGAASLTLSGQF
jgi:hypothetical protein